MNNSGKLESLAMTKQNVRIAQGFKEQINLLLPEIYSAFAVALHNKGYSTEQINDLFMDTQDLWNECVQKDINMPTWCKEITGVDVQQAM